MCILFLLVGDATKPTILCSNRDEYFDRRTTRGTLDQNRNCYAPRDEEGGGSWIMADGLAPDSNDFKYSVVLNLHYWRERYPFVPPPEIGVPVPKTRAMSTLRSRGLLTKNFMNQKDILASIYAKSVYHDRSKYRPFNLIVSDASGTYYISSSVYQTDGPEKLIPGRLYSVTNGYLHSNWDKTSIGKYFIDMALVNELKVCSHISASPVPESDYKCTDIDTIPLRTTTLNTHNIKTVVHKLVEVMQTNTPLADPDFGRRSMSAMHTCAVFARPILIVRRPLRKSFYFARQLLIELLQLCLYLLSLLVGKLLGGHRDASKPSPRTWRHIVRLWLHRCIALSYFQPASYYHDYNTHSQQVVRDADLFGTRTITVLCYVPGSEVAAGEQAPAQTGGTAVDGMSHHPPIEALGESAQPAAGAAVVVAATSSRSTKEGEGRNTTSVGKRGCYYILERDLNTDSMQWSDQAFTNSAAVVR